MTIDAARRSALLATKLGALVREHAGEAPCVFGSFGAGAALVRTAPDGSTDAWVLPAERPTRSVGPALAWARQQRAARVEVVLDDAEQAGVVARRASYFSTPIGVWIASGRTLTRAEATSLPIEALPHPAVADLAPLIVAGGATPVVEHGVLVGEVAGLEVCRTFVDPETGVARLEVGVGAHDREAFLVMHGGVPTVEALAGVVAAVASHRADFSRQHPLNRLGAERLLRHRLLERPELVGAVELDTASPPEPRTNLNDPVPCVASGLASDGTAVVVVCSSGVDLDLAAFAADARAMHAAHGRLVVALPARDRLPVTVALIEMLTSPATIVTVDL